MFFDVPEPLFAEHSEIDYVLCECLYVPRKRLMGEKPTFSPICGYKVFSWSPTIPREKNQEI